MNLNPKALGMTVSVLTGAFWFIAMSFSLLTGLGKRTLDLLGGMHPFYHYTWGGMLTLVIEHLIFGFIVGWIFARLYNKFST